MNSRITVFRNANIWQDKQIKDNIDLAVFEGKIAAIGVQEVVNFLASNSSYEVDNIDLKAGTLLPSFGEAHAHPIFGALEDAGPQIRSCATIEGIQQELSRYAAANPHLEWINGASYDGSLVEGGLFRKEWIDEVISDRPVMLRAWDYHTVWVNSKALEVCGIDEKTSEPEIGEIPRNEDGSLIGVMREWGAVELITKHNPGFSLEEKIAALMHAQERYLGYGITWIQDAWVEDTDLEVYIEAARRGLLKCRFNLALRVDSRNWPKQFDEIVFLAKKILSLDNEMLTLNTVKFFTDGVVENETGALIEPYCSSLHNHGMQVWQPDALKNAVSTLDAAGFQCHLHAIGDLAVKNSLDAIAFAREVNGKNNNRHVIAHAQIIAEEDIRRFSKLDVIACVQPLWAQLDPLMTVLTLPRLGKERSFKQYPFRKLLDNGAILAFGSDWPCSTANPWKGIAIALTRKSFDNDDAEVFMPEEVIKLEEALEAYTKNISYLAFADQRENLWGEIKLGASADLAWLDEDIRKIRRSNISELKFSGVMVRGQKYIT